MRETFQFPFPPIIGNNLKKAYIRYLDEDHREFLLDLSISNWAVRAVLGAIFVEQSTTQGRKYFQFDQNAIILVPGGVVIVPIQYALDPNYEPLLLSQVSSNLCYMTISGTNSEYPLPNPIQRSTEVEAQLQRAGRDRYNLIGYIAFDTDAGARAASTSLRLQLSRDFSQELAEQVTPKDNLLELLFPDMSREESIELLFYIVSGKRRSTNM